MYVARRYTYKRLCIQYLCMFYSCGNLWIYSLQANNIRIHPLKYILRVLLGLIIQYESQNGLQANCLSRVENRICLAHWIFTWQLSSNIFLLKIFSYLQLQKFWCEVKVVLEIKRGEIRWSQCKWNKEYNPDCLKSLKAYSLLSFIYNISLLS